VFSVGDDKMASPFWITLSHPPNYLNFSISVILGILLLMYSRLS
jgi:hypothetical protein